MQRLIEEIDSRGRRKKGEKSFERYKIKCHAIFKLCYLQATWPSSPPTMLTRKTSK